MMIFFIAWASFGSLTWVYYYVTDPLIKPGLAEGLVLLLAGPVPLIKSLLE